MAAAKKPSVVNRIQRTESYAEKVRLMFAQTVNEILALNKTMPILGEGEMFSFDGESMKKQKQVETLLRQLRSAATLAIQKGIRCEWEEANQECDNLIKSVFGKEILSSTTFNGWTNRNTEAMNAFINRSDRGMNLSDRVWKATRQLRDEMEVAITLGIGEGDSAASMSRKVRQYLNDPDLMFRRFRVKIGEKEVEDVDADGKVIGTHTESVYGRKWKKKVKGDDGRVRWIDYDKDLYKDKWTGSGYYKSSAQNAMRVARTETNIAYRRADKARWNSLDFVLGMHIEVSNHTRKGKEREKDICDKLQGDYPKDFNFDGWHPQCYSEDSEVLTVDGWKLFSNVRDSDRILSLNPETRDIEYVGIIDRQRYEKHGEMVHFFNRSLDCLVTDEHQMVYLNKSDGRIERCNADKFKCTKGAFYRGCIHQDATEQTYIRIGSKEIVFDDYCEFLGYWLADGSLERNSGVCVAQKRGQLLRSDIADCIARMGYIPKFRDLTVIFYNRYFNAFLKRFGHAHDKFIPNDILNASKRQIRIFLNAFISCDGSIRQRHSFIGSHGNLFHSEKQERLFYTTSPKMAGNIGELLLKIGKRPSYYIQKASASIKKDGTLIKGKFDCWRISECDSVTSTVFNKEIVQYNGYVYDLSLERNHIMYIRRNGKCFWGSNCFCIATPILMDEDEMAKKNDAFLKGETYTPKGKQIKDYPDGFKNWVKGNEDKIINSRDRGTEPYFIRNNSAVVDEILNPQPKALTIAEKAKIRHDARTPEQIQKIKDRANQRHNNIATKKYGTKILDYMKGISDVDTSVLAKAINSGNITIIAEEAKKLKDIGKEILSLSKLDDPMAVAKKFSFTDAKSVNNAVISRLARESFSSLSAQKTFLEGEIKWVEEHKKYNTWEVARDAYKKELASVNRLIEVKAVSDSVQDAILFATTQSTDTILKALAMGMKNALADKNITLETLKIKADELNIRYKAEYAKIKAWIDLQTKASTALAYATTTSNVKYKTLATNVNLLLSSRSGAISTATKKVNELNAEYKKLYDAEISAKYGSTPVVTIDDIIAKLGDKTPKTLKELGEALKKFKYTDSELKTNEIEINALMKKMFDENDFGMDIDYDLLESVYDKGFLNTFQSGSSHGYCGSSKTTGDIEKSHGRLKMAHRMFLPSTHGELNGSEYSGSQLSRGDYEKYGHLLDRDKYECYTKNKTHYGNVQVRFKKEKVLCTWTFNDSLHSRGKYFQPSLTSDPHIESFDEMCWNKPTSKSKWNSVSQWQRETGTSYVELQYHGDVTIDYVESMTFAKNPETYLSQDLIRRLLAKGVELWYIDGTKMVMYRP